MGTKLEYAINLLATSRNSSNSFTVLSVDDWDYFGDTDHRGLKGREIRRSGPDRFHQDSMDRNALEKHNIDSIKRTMQMHEDTFKHQVRELHRLYSVQKMLMKELKKEMDRSRFWNTPMVASDVNHSHLMISPRHQTPQSACGYHSIRVQGSRDDPISSRDRSGSCSGDNMRMPRGFDLERPVTAAAGAEEDISTGVSAIEEDHQAGPSSRVPLKKSVDGSDDESEVELTLSIGGSSSSKKRSSKDYSGLKGSRELHSPASFKSDRGGGECSDPTTPMSSSSATFDQDRKRPHWLFQGLSLNSGS